MTYLTFSLTQTVTHWAPTAIDKFGASTWATPVALLGRWEEDQELFIDGAGTELRSKAVVYLDTDVTEGDYIFEGTSVGADPTAVVGAYRVRAFRKIPELVGVNFERKAML